MVLGSYLLRLPEADLEEAVARELDDNPALERAGDTWWPTAFPPRWEAQDAGRPPADRDEMDGSDRAESTPARESTFDQLVHQARLLVPSTDFAYVAYLIYSLNEHGFLTTPDDELAQELHLSHDGLARAIGWLQQLDPPGLGARDVHECLDLQRRALETHGVDCPIVRLILDQAWEAFTQQQWQRVATLIGCTLVEVHDAVGFMCRHFYLFPLLLISSPAEDGLVLTHPDLVVRRSAQEGAPRFVVEVPGADMTRVRISPFYERTARTGTAGTLAAGERAWVQQALEQARLFIHGLDQRYTTLKQLGEYLVTYQADFFTRGRSYLKPLTRAEVARHLGLHPSTISRAVSDKILQLPDGRLMELCDLFDASLAVKEAIRALLIASPGPLSDREIAEQLHAQAFHLSRRTVAQYREELGIPCRSRRPRCYAPAKPQT
jgi:RNA polymerase sigma-54 factor